MSNLTTTGLVKYYRNRRKENSFFIEAMNDNRVNET